MPDNSFVLYGYSHGSCSGCDTWESAGLSEADIIAEMQHTAAKLSSREAVTTYYSNLGSEDYIHAGAAFNQWCLENPEPIKQYDRFSSLEEL